MRFHSIQNFVRHSFVPRVFAVLLLTFAVSGCNYLIFAGYLIGGPPSIEPDFDKKTGESFTSFGVKVAVVCYAPTELKWDFDEIDYEISKYVANRLFTHHITVISPDYIHDWLDKNDDWDKPDEIGRAFDTSYVVYIDLHEYSLYEKNSANLYRGHAEAIVSVFKMDEDGTGEKIYTKELTSKFPLSVPRSTSEITYSSFKRAYLQRLSEEIGRLFYEAYNGDDIPDAT